MSEQLDIIYDYMIKNGKKLRTKHTCKICKQLLIETEFGSSKSICKECWNTYIKLSKYEKKEIEMSDYCSWAEYSERLGRSRDYLSNYKHKYPHIKTPKQAYDEVLKRVAEQEEVCGELDKLLTYLVSNRRLESFQQHLLRTNPSESKKSLRRIRVTVSMNRINLLETDALNHYKKLIKEINEWM